MLPRYDRGPAGSPGEIFFNKASGGGVRRWAWTRQERKLSILKKAVLAEQRMSVALRARRTWPSRRPARDRAA